MIGSNRSAPDLLFLPLALSPVVGLAVYALLHASFAFLDDAVTVAMSRAPWWAYFQISESGRVFPVYWIGVALPLRLLGEHPWALQLRAVIGIVAGVGLMYYLVSRTAGAAAGVLASWLATATLACAESLYTLSKAESLQVALWLIALVCLGGIAAGPSRARLAWLTVVGCVACAATMLTKETGLLLVVPAAVLLLPGAMTGSAGAWRRRAVSSGTIILPLFANGALVASTSLRSTSYLQSHVLVRGVDVIPAMTRDLQLGALLLTGLFFGIMLVARKRGSERTMPLLITAQLAALTAFFFYLPDVYPYFLLVPSFLAAGLVAASTVEPGRLLRWTARLAAAVLLVWGAEHAIFGASALSGWSWLYGRITYEVSTRHPTRVFFLNSSNPETLAEARLWWRGSVSQVATVDPGRTTPGSGDVFALQDLRAGDWIVERFGPVQNVAVPLRDLEVTFPAAAGVQSVLGGVSATRVARFRATYPEFINLPYLRAGTTYIEWQISRVDHPPRLLVLGLDMDHWMYQRSELMSKGAPGETIRLEFDPFLPSPSSSNSLSVRSGQSLITQCQASARRCSFRIPAAATPDSNGWHRIELSAANVFRPSEAGISADSRPLSFHLTSVTAAAQ